MNNNHPTHQDCQEQAQQPQGSGTYWQPGSVTKIGNQDKDHRKERCSSKQQIKALVKCLQQHPEFKDLSCYKPKQSPNQRLLRLSENIAAPSTLAPVLTHALKRYFLSIDPANDLEQGLFKTFDQMTDSQKEALRKTLKTFEAIPDHLQKRVFNPRFIDLPVDISLSPTEIAEELADEVLKHGMQFEYPRARFSLSGCAPGKIRPKRESYAPDHFSPALTVTPTICSIQGLRRAGFYPSPERWSDAELMRKCATEGEGDRVRLVCDDYITWEEGCPDEVNPDGICLRVPTARPGQSVDISGYNFISSDCQVYLRRRDDPTQVWLLEACVLGDQETPLRELVAGQWVYIADCRVEDHLTFTIPTLRDGINEFLPGDYEIRARVRNPGDYHDIWTASESMAPEFLESGVWHLIHIVPRADIPYQISLNELICDEETDGIGSDDVYLRFMVYGVRIPEESPAPLEIEFDRYPAPDPWRNKDVDSNESFAINRGLFSNVFPDILAITILGFEVDDEELLEQEIMDFDEAFIYALEYLWAAVGPTIVSKGPDWLKDLVDEVGPAWSALIIGITIALTLGVAALWATWGPPDPIITDLIVIPAEMMHYLTYPTNPLIEAYNLDTINGIRLNVLPESKLANDYLETRRYRSEDEDSTYRLRLRYTRL